MSYKANMCVLAKDGGSPYKLTPFPDWPIYSEKELRYLKEVLESKNWWRVSGSKVSQFEEKFAKFQDCEYCLAVANGTSALEIALLAINVGYGDEVIVPAMTFVSTALSVINCNATPVLVDIDKDTLCMNVEEFEKAITYKTKAVIPVHMAGNACEMDEICKIAKKYNITVIEDAAHAHGGKYKGKKLGSLGDMSIFSFQNGKLMSSGEGGALLTNNRELYEKAYLMQDVGRPKGDIIYQHKVRGINSRMSEFQAAVLLAQMERVEKYNNLREKNSKILDKILKNKFGIIPQKRSENTDIMTHYMYMFYFSSSNFKNLSRNKFVEYLVAEGIPASVCFPVFTELEFYKNKDFNGKMVDSMQKDIKIENSEYAAENVVWLHHRVLEGTERDLLDIYGAIEKIYNCI